MRSTPEHSREPEQLGSHASTCDANSTPSDPGGQRPTRRSRRPPPSAADRLRRLPTDGYYAARRDRLPMPLRYKGSSDFNRPATFRKTSCMFARGFSREASGPPSPGEPPASAEDHLAIRKMKALLSKQYRTTRVDPLHSYLATNRIRHRGDKIGAACALPTPFGLANESLDYPRGA